MAEKLEIAIDARKSESGAEEVEGAFDTMVKAASGAADKMDSSGKKIDDSFDDNAEHAEKAGKGVIDFKSAFVFTAAIAGVVALAASVQAVVSDIDALGKAAAKSGTSLDFFQRLEFAGSQSGIEIASLEGSLKDLQLRMGQAAAGSQPMIDAFEAAGVSIKDANGEMRSLEDVFPDVLDGIAKLGGGAESAALGVQLMGESFTQNAVLFRDGSGALKELGDQAASLGIIMSEDTFAAAADLGDQMDILTRIIKVGFASTLTALAPILINTIQFIQQFAGRINDLTEKFAILIGIADKKVFKGFTDQSDNAISSVAELNAQITGLQAALTRLGEDNPASAAIRETIKGLQSQLITQGGIVGKIEDEKQAIVAKNALAIRWGEALITQEDARFKKQLENIAIVKQAEQDALISQIGIGTEGLDEVAGPTGLTATQDALRTETDMIAQSLLTQDELHMQSLMRRQEAIQSAVDERVITEERGMELLTQIDEKETYKRSLIIAGSVSTAIGGFVQLAQAFRDKNGEMTTGAKVLASTQVVINTAVGIMKSYADLGPIAGSFAAIGIAAAGVAQLATIHGAGAGGGSINGTSAGLSTPQQPAFESSANITREERSSKEINVYISGYTNTEIVLNDIMPAIRTLIDDNDEVIFSETSRQAQILGGA